MRQLVFECAVSITFLLFAKCAGSQVGNPYYLNGSATQDNCHCYTLTKEILFQSGSVWNINKIDLTQSFDFTFNVFLGCNDPNGADGIAFVLQTGSTSLGAHGQGLGYQGISPSIGIAIDTWQNVEDNDPSFDNISILKNGNIIHSVTSDLALPVPVLASEGNIADCKFHTFRIIWDASAKFLNTQIDGVDRVSATVDPVKDIFGGDPMVYWGFTGATGGAFNLQRVCASLHPMFNTPGGQNVCYPAPLNFMDSSRSFGTILKWNWDFGDGTLDSVQNPAPHVYAKPGKYDVKLSIVGNDDCLSDPAVKVIVCGSKPVAGYYSLPLQPCKGVPVLITDSSRVEFGTVDKWSWDIAGHPYSTENPGQIALSGKNRIGLTVGTQEGCVSDLMVDTLNIRPLPCPDFYVPSAFSPNNDKHNDKFEFVAPGIVSIEMFKVFNRYGQLVYTSTDFHAAWDGTFKGVAQPSGTYVWMIRGRDFDGGIHFKKGIVILIR